MKKEFKVFLKGIFMGAADIVPGVSGGTIALITGIYERLILSINNIILSIILLIKSFFKKEYRKEFKNSIKKADLKFFIILVTGVVVSFMTISRFILTGIQNYPAYIFSFFFGLILASAIMIGKKIKFFRKSLFVAGFLGFSISLLIVSLEGLGASHTLPFIFVSGFAGACAMLLPGISGSFVLLLLGQYEFMLSALKNINIPVIATFIFAMIVGGSFISKVISYFIKKHEQKTFSFLIGLMIGGLGLPLKNIIAVPQNFWSFLTLAGAFFSLLAGIILVFSIERLKDTGHSF